MPAYQTSNYTPGLAASRRMKPLKRDGTSHSIPSRYGREPVIFNNPLPFDDPVYSTLARRDSIWSNASTGPLALGVGAAFGGGADKFPYMEVADLPCAVSPTYMPSTASSVTCPSTISQSSSGSPVLTEATSSRGPSPLQNSTNAPYDTPETPRHSMTARKGGLAAQRPGLHVCLWGSGGACEGGDFATREELNRHVKMEHLLECPVLGCVEAGFETRDMLACHMKWDHSNSDKFNNTACQTANLLEANHTPSQNISDDTPTGKAVANRMHAAEDRVLKMEMSIGISKKRCREQLRTVLEKRLRRANGHLRSADSPGTAGSRTPKLLDSASFPVLWEHGVLPFLIEFMPKWSGPGHAISVTRGRKPDTRRICIMTARPLTKARRMVIAGHVRDLLPEPHRSTVSFVFSTGTVDRLVWARGLGKQMPDEVCEARNPFAYLSPCMGDSIGASLDDGEEATATLGPCVTAEGGSYWLACFHPFIGASQRTSPVLIEHPSPQDRAQCVRERHDALDGDDANRRRLGNLTATSGFDLKTTRITHEPYWDDCDKEPPLVVMDWILVSSGTRQPANLLRKFPSVAPQRRETPVTTTTPVAPGASVVSTGRTSGFQRGVVCESPAYVDAALNGTGKATREWFVEEPCADEDDNEWIRGGIGVEGDSGAAIVDSETNGLLGQLWGRNKYWGRGPRVTYFTPISDIFDDIQEKCGMSARPQLPQYRDEADRWPVYPVCKQCSDLREYLDSRRSSRESMMSMIGFHDPRAEHDIDVATVSELATPKDQSYLVRHIGPEEMASSLGGGHAVSPAPIHGFYPISQAASPGMVELRSPYPQALSEEDLYEPRIPKASEVALGKRPANTTQDSDKRRRITYAGHA